MAFSSTASTSSSLRCCTIIYSEHFSSKPLFDRREFWRAVCSSALIDGLFFIARLQQPNDIGSVAAHIAIGFTGQRHRHSGVVRLNVQKQRMACPDCKRCVRSGPHNLHQPIRPRRTSSGQNGALRARFLIRYSASDWPLPDDRFTEHRSIVGPSMFTPPADFLLSECSLAAFPLSLFQPSHRYHAGVDRVPRPRQWPTRFAPVCSP